MAGEVHPFALTVKGDSLLPFLSRPVQNLQVREIDKETGYIKVDCDACEVDLLDWFGEQEDIVGVYPAGTLINWFRIYR